MKEPEDIHGAVVKIY